MARPPTPNGWRPLGARRRRQPAVAVRVQAPERELPPLEPDEPLEPNEPLEPDETPAWPPRPEREPLPV